MSPSPKSWKSRKGFTLAEILIALAILSVIATFTIPKIISNQQDGRNNAIVKETAATMVAAFQQHQQLGLLTTSMNASALFPYINYLKIDTTSLLDGLQTQGSVTCTSRPCIALPNGAIIYPGVGVFSGTNTTNAIHFYIDPDGQYSGTTNGPGKSVGMFLYYNGRITTYGTADVGTLYAGGTIVATPAYDPPWFSW
jgi:prepilin-type N-terminal cleavage/methylation domain-containing protein